MSDENILYWSPDYELKLSDFKKEFDKKDRQVFSYVGYSIDHIIKYNEDLTKYVIQEIRLQTIFWHNKSFFNHVKAENCDLTSKKIDYLMPHEQGHFDLAEELLPKIKRKIESQCKGISFRTRGPNLKETKNNALE